MKVVALRGVCIGVEQHLLPGEEADVDPNTGNYLLAIKAVQEVFGEPVVVTPRGRKRQPVSVPEDAPQVGD